jgi:hypothetical protein
LTFSGDRYPLRLPPPPGSGCHTAPPCHCSTKAPLLIFPSVSSPPRCREGADPDEDLQRFGDATAGSSSPRLPTCSRFLPSAGPLTLTSAGPDSEARTRPTPGPASGRVSLAAA